MSTATLPGRGTQTGYGTCIGCQGVRFLDVATRLCRQCFDLEARDTAPYCGACGLPTPDHRCDRPGAVAAYCARDGWWLGTHPQCPAAAS